MPQDKNAGVVSFSAGIAAIAHCVSCPAAAIILTPSFSPITVALLQISAKRDPDDSAFATEGDLPQRIRDFCKKTNQPVPESTGAVIRCIYESLAMKYRFAIEQISENTGKVFDVLHLLGGGTKDSFLCQMTADSLGFDVVAGPTVVSEITH
mgnify:CR=1 FL=1